MRSAMEGVDSRWTGRAIAFDFPAGGAAAATRVPRRIRRRLLEARSSLPSSVEEIEAKLRDAHLRRQKGTAKPRSSSWLAQEDDPDRRLEARLCAAEQKSLNMTASKIIGALVASFGIAYVCDAIISDKKIFGGTIPKTISDKEWREATDKRMQAWPRTAGPPVVMNPISRQNYIVKPADS